MTEGLRRACSGPPESGSKPYAAGPGTAGGTVGIRLVPPRDPPHLTPGAALALLRILLKAYDRLRQEERREES